jgi:prevent-host-death family protein
MVAMMNISTKEIAAGAFKATCLRLIDEVAERREEIVITKRGKPLAKLVPVVEQPPELVGWLRGTVSISGDIVASPDERWDADKKPDGGPDA